MADWQAVKTEYITTDTSYRKLAEKYDINYKVIADRGKKEGWGDLRSQHKAKTLTRTLDKISEKEAKRAERILTVADKILNKIEAIVDSDAMDDRAIRAITAAVKDLKEIQGIKTKLDLEEQRARIDNLRRQAASDSDSTVEIVIGEGLEEYTV